MAKIREINELNQDEQRHYIQRNCEKNFWIFTLVAIGSIGIGPAFGQLFYFFVAITFIATVNAVVAWLSDHYIQIYRNVAVASGRGRKPTREGCKLMCKYAKTINDWSSFGVICYFAGYLQRLLEVSGIVELLFFLLLLFPLILQHLTLSLADEAL